MIFDLHTHHSRCGHAQGEVEDYIQSAISAGLQMVGISDHSPFFGSNQDQAFPAIAMAVSEFPNYIAEVLRLKHQYADRIEVLLGVESDFFPEHADLYRQQYQKYPFDYIIGSVHLSGGTSIFNRTRWKGLSDQRQVEEKEIYYELISESARSGMFDILGHIDAMKGFYPPFSDISTDAADRSLRVIADSDVAIEINTSGSTKAVGGWYPSDAILERALFYGVTVTFGSDAHIPSRIADEWELVRKRLKEIGFTEWAYWRGRRRYMSKL